MWSFFLHKLACEKKKIFDYFDIDNYIVFNEHLKNHGMENLLLNIKFVPNILIVNVVLQISLAISFGPKAKISY